MPDKLRKCPKCDGHPDAVLFDAPAISYLGSDDEGWDWTGGTDYNNPDNVFDRFRCGDCGHIYDCDEPET
jgi:hypothetical protein